MRRLLTFLVLFISTTCFSQTTFLIVDDSYVQFASPTSNFGTATDVRVRNTATDTLRAFFKFTTTGLSGTVTLAKLRLYVSLGGASSGGQVYSITDDSWTEGAITWNNQPARVTDLGALPAATLDTIIELDVTSYVTGNDTYSFVVVANSSQNTRFRSEENTSDTGPELVVTAVAASGRRVTKAFHY